MPLFSIALARRSLQGNRRRRRRDALPILEALEHRALLSVTNPNNAPVIPHVQVTAVFYGFGTDPASNDRIQYLDDFLKDILPSAYMDVLNQYGAGRGSFSGAYTASGTFGSAPVQFSTIQSMLSNGMSSGGLPYPTSSQIFLVFLPPGVTLPPAGGNSVLGHHGNFFLNSTDVRWAVASNTSGLTQQTKTATHELAETVTDPDGFSWFDRSNGPTYGNEIGETGPNGFGLPSGSFDGYSVSQLWSNAANGPVIDSNVTNWSTSNGWLSQIVTTTNFWGDNVTLGIGGNHAVYEQVTPPGGSPGGWTNLGGWVSQITVAHDASGNLDVFGIGGNHAVYELNYVNWYQNTWWDLGGSVSEIQSATLSNGMIQIFGIGSDGNLYSNVQYNVWSQTLLQGWASLGKPLGNLTLAPGNSVFLPVNLQAFTVQPLNTGGVEVFAVSPIGQLFYNLERTPSGGWSGWTNIVPPNGDGVAGSSQIATAIMSNGDLALFTIDATTGWIDVAYQNLSTGGFSPSWVLSSTPSKSLTVGHEADGRLAVFAIDFNNLLHVRIQDSPPISSTTSYLTTDYSYWTNNGWFSFGGGLLQVTVAYDAAGDMEVIGIGLNNAVWYADQHGANGSWT